MAFTLGAAPAEAGEDGAGNASVAATTYTAERGLVALVQWNHATVTLNSVTYDPGGANETALTPVGTILTTGVSNQKSHIYYLSNVPTTASKVVRATWSGSLSGAGTITVREIIGGDLTDMLDASGSATGNSSGPAATTVTPNTANCAMFAIAASGVSDLTEDTGYTLLTIQNPSLWAEGEYNLDVGAAGAKTVQMTHGGSAAWGIKAAAFKLAAAGGGGGIPSELGRGFHPGRGPMNMARFYQTPKGHRIISGVVFRKTLSKIGTRTGSRQTHDS